MQILNEGILKSHMRACDISSMDEGVQDCGMKFDEILLKIEMLLGEEHKDLILSIESAMNEYAFADSFAVYKIGVSDGMQLQQEINALSSAVKV